MKPRRKDAPNARESSSCRVAALTDDAADRAHLARIANGDQDALRRLYEAYHPRLWRYLWFALAGDEALVEEVIQDCFLAVWQSAASFRGTAKVATWLFQIAHNRAVNARRKQGRTLDIPFATEDDLPGDDAFEEAVINRVVLAQAIGRLAPMHQEVLHLFFYRGFTLTEIATILQIPVGTVKSRLNHARRALLLQLGTATPQEDRS
jgi:RNA polymerase sigma factor (sigma-70 family)